MDEQERAEYEKEGKREREEHVKKVGQQLVEELQYTLGPKLKKHKELFISCVEHIFEKWMGGQYKDDYSVVYALEKLFYIKLSFEEGYEVWTSSPAGEMSMQSTNEDFPPGLAEKIGRKIFAGHIGAKEEKARFTKKNWNLIWKS